MAWLSGVVPFPPDQGWLAYSDGLSAALAATGCRVTGLGLRHDGAGAGEPPVGAVRWHTVPGRRRSARASLLSPLPNIASSFATPPFARAVDRELARRPDVVVIDHLHMGWVASRVPQPEAPGRPLVVYVAHNHEASMRVAIAREVRASAMRRLALRRDAIKAERLEQRVVGAADLVICLTPADEEAFQGRSPRPRHTLVLTPGHAGGRHRPDPALATRPRRVVLLGSLLWHVKRSNAERLVKVAGPPFERHGVELVVAGPIDDAFARRLRATWPGVRVVGRVDDVDALLATSRLGLVCEPVGGGFKLKALDYVFSRIPIAALAGGVTGLPLVPGESVLAYETVEALVAGVVDSIDRIDRLASIERNAYNRCRTGFDWPERGARLRTALDDLIIGRDGRP